MVMPFRTLVISLSLLAVAAGCDKLSDPSNGDVPFVMTATGPINLTAAPGAQITVGVKVVGSRNTGLSGIPVKFTVSSASGSVNPINATTNTSGIATTAWTLSTAGEQMVTANVDGIPSITFDVITKATGTTTRIP